jgi:uracil DNA glycosylase
VLGSKFVIDPAISSALWQQDQSNPSSLSRLLMQIRQQHERVRVRLCAQLELLRQQPLVKLVVSLGVVEAEEQKGHSSYTWLNLYRCVFLNMPEKRP